ncbi:3-hydroxyacyl-CoA dehydrogenase, NAD binding domain protein [Bordetella bronchiseptica 00-P-2796]|uniref:3-hydroxyacyl-CoA dehydrogenase, NAD binding domain protein n=1 Tax=Bordetella bronchiseptica 00-P-2796 TaxID=1331199 RepID=A0ABR4REC3_BORBO|nr:3-hydroxyacyl-CoA dehydrogenase, NAD binding domain protein [Bordetella bronchiseptica 00-P-2796]
MARRWAARWSLRWGATIGWRRRAPRWGCRRSSWGCCLAPAARSACRAWSARAMPSRWCWAANPWAAKPRFGTNWPMRCCLPTIRWSRRWRGCATRRAGWRGAALPVCLRWRRHRSPRRRARPPSGRVGSAAAREAALACLAAAQGPFDAGRALERESFARLRDGAEARALRYAFFAERPRPPAGDVSARRIEQVAVVGAGTMGTGIVICLADAGLPVIWHDVDADRLAQGRAQVCQHFERLAARKRLTSRQAEQRVAAVATTGEMAGIAQADLAIEAVFEDMAVKCAVFRELDRVLKPGAILGTNTSTLDVDRIAHSTRRPQDVVGLHFFSPAPVMPLLEIVRGAATHADVVAAAQGLARRLRKTAVVAGVCDGFIGNRMWHQYLRQAALMVHEGAMPMEVDAALRDWGFAMGPFQVADLAGLDVGDSIRLRQRSEMPHRPWPDWLDRVSAAGRLGLKGGSGIHAYPDGGRQPRRDAEVEAMIAAASREAGVSRRAIAADEIVERCLHALVVEAARLLEEGIAASATDVDAVFLAGYGFPRWRGGPCHSADAMGLPAVVAGLRRRAATAEPEFWQPPGLLARLAAQGGRLQDHGQEGA